MMFIVDGNKANSFESLMEVLTGSPWTGNGGYFDTLNIIMLAKSLRPPKLFQNQFLLERVFWNTEYTVMWVGVYFSRKKIEERETLSGSSLKFYAT